MYEEPEEDVGSLIHGSRELQLQIVLAAIVVMVFALIVVILPLLFTPPDPVIALIFSLLLAAGGAFLGGSLIYGYFKVRVGAEARGYAEEMMDEALHGKAARKSVEELVLDEKERLVAKLEKEKQEYYDSLQAEFNKRLDEEENVLMEDVRREFEKQMEKEKQQYLSKVDQDLRSQVTEEHKSYQDSVREEYLKRFDEEKKAYQKAIREEFEKRVEDERKAYDAKLADLEAQLQSEKRKFTEKVSELEDRRKTENEEYETRQAVFDQHIQAEKKLFSEQMADLEKKYQDEKKAVEESLRSEFERRTEVEKQAYTDIIRKDFEYWKKEFTDEFRKEIMRDVPPPKTPEPPKPQEAPPWVDKGKPQAAKSKDDLSDIFPEGRNEPPAEAKSEPKEERTYDFRTMDARQQLECAVDFLLGGRNRGSSLTFRNTKTRRQLTLKGRGKDLLLESAVEEISIKSRLMLREFAAQKRLPMEKTDDHIRIMLGSDIDSAKCNLREAVETAFATPVENLAFDVKTDQN